MTRRLRYSRIIRRSESGGWRPSLRGQLVALLLPALLIAPSPLFARPPYKHSLKKLYGSRLPAALHQCTACHLAREEVDNPNAFDPEYPPHNVFGQRLKGLGEEAADGDESVDIIPRLKRVAAEDADGDGAANELEIFAGRQPGRATSVPTADELAAATEQRETWKEETGRYAWEPFRRVERPDLPAVDGLPPDTTPVDAFLAVEHQRLGLPVAGPAPPQVLLRRVYLDLIGLPPTRDQLRAFLTDPSPAAYRRVVAQLLDSPQYGQRWGRHWMDVWRYSDWAGWTDGKQIRDSQPHIWRWRDWIVDALNADRPYDEMVRAMLAADELAPDRESDLPATGFLVRNYKMLSRETWLQETVEHTAKALLGITMNCARCHDHMYDPISQAEYYRYRAIFEPHNVRIDRLPGQADTTVDGLPRVFDAEPAAATYLFVKGDDRNPNKDLEIAAATPEILGGSLSAQPVRLPAAARYPGLKPFVQEQLLSAASAAVAKAQEQATASQAALAAADDRVKQLTALAQQGTSPAEGAPDPSAELPAAQQALATAQRAHEAAAAATAAAQAAVQSLKARIAADRAKFADPPDASAAELAQAACHAERAAAAAQASHEALLAEHALAELAAKHPTPDEAQQKQLDEARGKRDAAREKQMQAAAAVEQPGETYTPIVPEYPAESTGRRAALARWVTSRDNPLAARVAANHIWLRHFGQGLVESTFDFGQNGKPPSHPALLDWLAVELMEPTWQVDSAAAQDNSPAAPRPWSMKHLHRLLVTSAAYRRASLADEQLERLDADNRYLARMPSRRMEAELVRDAVFYVAGQLDVSPGGPDIDYAQGLAVPRRSLYFRHAAEKQMTFLKIFDAAAVTECYRRKSSVMPQQALALANSELTIAQSRRLARAWQAQGPSDPAEFVAAAFEQVLSRAATAAEIETCLRFLESRAGQAQPAADGGAFDPADVSKPAPDPALRARENLIHVLLNHHDFVTIH